jgi:ATP-dependent DNA helicase PIF1
MRKIKFITGSAGTGKSHRLKELLNEEKEPHLVCAPTGIAAVGVGGSTLHRTFKINSNSGFVGKKWYEIKTVYIDEASMMGSKLFEAATVGAPNANFVLVGDMAQLPPVKDKYWFQTPYISTFDVSIERLTKQWRQANCPELSSCLDKIRSGVVQATELRKLYSSSCHPDDNTQATVLAFRNDTVRAINAERLLNLKGEMVEVEAEYGGAMQPQDCKAERFLCLKAGAEIIMLNNQLDSLWQNGTRGVVIGFDNDLEGNCISVAVRIANKIYNIDKHQWTLKVPQEVTPARRIELEDELERADLLRAIEIRNALETGIEYVVIGSCKQFPMKLAYALTVHKSQGLTLDKVHVITSGFAGCFGIGYVAMSRARDLEYLSLDRKPTVNDFKFDERIKQYI